MGGNHLLGYFLNVKNYSWCFSDKFLHSIKSFLCFSRLAIRSCLKKSLLLVVVVGKELWQK